MSESATADLALGQPAGEGNRFHDNEFDTSLPTGIESGLTEGSPEVSAIFAELESRQDAGEFPSGNYRDQPIPGAQPTMPDPEAPPRPAVWEASWVSPRPQTDGFQL